MPVSDEPASDDNQPDPTGRYYDQHAAFSLLFERPTPTLVQDELTSTILLGHPACYTIMGRTTGMSDYCPVGVKRC